MKFQVTDVEIDFEENGEYPSAGYQEELTCDSLTKLWESDNEIDLVVEMITCATGWCIKSFYKEV